MPISLDSKAQTYMFLKRYLIVQLRYMCIQISALKIVIVGLNQLS